MPNAAEKIAHIEAALRRRFFPLVPQRAQRWTPEQHDVDRCSRSLAAYALCGACGISDAVAAGALLDFLTLKYGCAVPRRAGGSYTLGELLPAVNGKLLTALKVDVLDPKSVARTAIIELKPIIEQISRIAQTRNVLGAHFNILSFDLYPQDGIKFAKLVEQLADALICPYHGWPNKDKSGSYWNNGGDTRRLHPLKKPA